MLTFLKKRFKKKSKFLTFLILWLVSIFLLPFIVSAQKNVKNFPEQLPKITDTNQIDMTTPEYVIIRPSDQATFSSETTASIEEVFVKEGSRFQKGDTLLIMDCRLQKAELHKALAQQLSAKKAKDSAIKLKSYGSISEFEVVKATSDEQIANAEVEKLRAVVDKCVIKAPFNGSVAELTVHSHETVKPGDPLMKIINTENLEFEMQVPSCWLQWLHIGSVFQVHINEINDKISAKITKINPQIEPVSQSVKIIATIIPNNHILLPGMSGQAIFPNISADKCAESKK